MNDNSDYIEVKVYSSGIYPSIAQKIIKQGVKGVISGGSISDNAKKLLDEAGVWYRENVEPSDLETEANEHESGE